MRGVIGREGGGGKRGEKGGMVDAATEKEWEMLIAQ